MIGGVSVNTTPLPGDAAITAAPRPARATWIDDWRPEDEVFWEATGAHVARRNLGFSILSEHVGFCIWSMWSVLVLFLGPEYGFDTGQKFLLTTLPTAVGAVLRVPYTFAVAKLGGRNWTVISSALLLVPMTATALVLEPGVGFATLLAAATLAGVGGGNFSSSMANIDAFYPQRLKGWALGLNAGGGNIGVAAVQLVGLAVLATAGRDHPRLVLAVYLPVVLASVVCAWRYMDNLTSARNDRGAMREVAGEPHTWAICLLYVGTFGSFIGFGFAFGQVLANQFGESFDTPVKVASLTFLGPLLGSLARPLGGRLADRFTGSRVTFWTFAAMSACAITVLAASRRESLALFLVGFVVLFVLSGLGNGSTYKMIPAIFRAKAAAAVAGGTPPEIAEQQARRRSRALIGLGGAIGALGGVAVNISLRQAFLGAGTGDDAYVVFIAYYGACLVLTWLVYRRPSSHRLAGV
jgi:MFS transporter, NNP family, nitrate/nitrite transporter